MKRKQYLLSTGSYDNYRVIAVVEGNATPALSTLRKRFYEQYGLVSAKKVNAFSSTIDIIASVYAECEAETRAQDDGYGEGGIGEQFLTWLIKEHGFVKVDMQEIHV